MKKTIITIAILATMVVALFATTVNAASIKAEGTIKEGTTGTVTVTIKTNEKVNGAVFKLNYDAEKFDYVKDSENGGTLPVVATDTGSYVKVVAVDALGKAEPTDTLTFQFTAKNTLKEGDKADFTITETEFDPEEDVTVDTATITVAKADTTKPTEPTNPTDPTNPSKPTTPDKDTNGKPIEGDLPQAGVPMFVGAIALIVVAGAVLVVRKRK